jgi:hypothetical protein
VSVDLQIVAADQDERRDVDLLQTIGGPLRPQLAGEWQGCR